MADFQMPSNATKIAAIHIRFECALAHIGRIASLLWFGCVFPLAVHTAVALGTGFRLASFVLACRGFAVWTLQHGSILAQPFRHSTNPTSFTMIRIQIFHRLFGERLDGGRL